MRAASKDGASGCSAALIEHRGNLSRDLIARCRLESGVNFDPYWVTTHQRKAAGLALEEVSKALLLPRELAAWIWRHSPELFQSVFGSRGDWCVYWANKIAANPPWFTTHPCNAMDRSTPHKLCPIAIFGDDGRVGKWRAMRVVHFFGECAQSTDTLRVKLPIFIRDQTFSVSDVTDAPLWRAVVWSLYCLLGGLHPGCDETNVTELTGWRRERAGEKIAGDVIFALARITGDWGWQQQTFHFRGFNDPECCHLCPATQHGFFDFRNVNEDAPAFAAHNARSTSEYLTSGAAALCPLTAAPGFSLDLCVPELMHAGPLGLNLSICGGTLYDLCQEAFFGGFDHITTWGERLNHQLGVAYEHFLHWKSHSGFS